MSGLFENLSVGNSALFAMQRAMQVVGNNISNANTPGFSRQRVDLSMVNSGGVVGIALWSSDNTSFHSTTTVSYLSAEGSAWGIAVVESDNTSFHSTTTVSYLNASSYEAEAFGIILSFWHSVLPPFLCTSKC